eukprot:scaffold12540_cov105-Cylindrotheca_fusiformis.AAC.2
MLQNVAEHVWAMNNRSDVAVAAKKKKKKTVLTDLVENTCTNEIENQCLPRKRIRRPRPYAVVGCSDGVLKYTVKNF